MLKFEDNREFIAVRHLIQIPFCFEHDDAMIRILKFN